MEIPDKIDIPVYPKFLFSPDKKAFELYVTCTSYVHPKNM